MKQKIVFALLKSIASLPLGVLYLFSDFIAFILFHLVKYRKKVVDSNLISSFPEKTPDEIKEIEKEYYRYLGDQIVETLKLLHISEKELRRRVKVINYEIVNATLGENKNAVLLMGHYNNWEWVQEISRYFLPQSYMASIYHPLKNKMWDEFFIRIRSYWGAHIVTMKQAPRVLLDRSHTPWVCGFIADARPDHIQANDIDVVEFLNHKTHFIPGPEIIGEKVGADYFYLEMLRIKRGYYEIKFTKLDAAEDQETKANESYPHLRMFWKEFEATIKKAPAYWLWSHKRWK